MDPTARIKSHMTRDHGLALVDYLAVYGKVDPKSIEPGTVSMTEVNTDSFTICYHTDSPQKVNILWAEATEKNNLKVKETSDIKAKLVSMAKHAAAKQGYSHTQIKKVVAPRPVSYPMYLFAALGTWAVFAPTSFKSFVKNDFLFSRIAAALPDAFKNYLSQRFVRIYFGMYLVHLFEIAVYSIPTFIKYRVPTKQRFQWLGMHFIEGFFVPLRLQKLKQDH